MKRYIILLALPIVFAAHFASAQMLADIRTDAKTAFGTYHPCLVSVQPSLQPSNVAPDFSNVVNFNQFPFTESKKNLLRQNHFVVSPRRLQGGTGYREMYDIYNEAREQGLPILVTTDAMLHTFHLVFDRVLKTCEEQRFYGWLEELLIAMYDETLAQQAAATDTLAQWALWRNLEYLNVARRLLDSSFVPAATIGLQQQELDLIKQHLPFTPSPIFEYFEDYTQYIVRGHYTQSDSLRRYFQSMMWLGRMTFDRDSVKFNLGAVFLTQALYRTQVNGRLSFQVWDDICQPTVFFVGKSDDIGPEQYRQIADQVYGPNFLSTFPDQLADRSLLSQFKEMARALPGPKIEYPGQPAAGFRLMGQRFIPDSYVLDELVFNKLLDLRVMPTGLDVMAVLGSAHALELLQQTPDWTIFPSYPVKLDSLRREFANYADTTWAQNVYWNWLYCLMPLLYPKGEGYPDWMQSAAWLDKDLLAALGSWAELRHDTILYAKQSGTETGVKPEAIGKQGYVEPNPHLYARLASLALFMQTGLANRDLLFPQFATSLERLHNVLTQLKSISEKELENRPLSAEDYATILKIGSTLEEIVEFTKWPIGGPRPDSEDAMPVIADVHTDASNGVVLEVGVGYPYGVYAICSIEGQFVITKGAGFSYHEFNWPLTDRLTDEAWRTMLQSHAPPPPQWSASFFAEGDWKNPQPDFYYWRAEWTAIPYARLASDTVAIGKPVNAEISHYTASGMRVWIETATGQQAIADSIIRLQTGKVMAIVPTTGLQAGPAWLVVEAQAPDNLSGERLMFYRAGFYLGLASAVLAPLDEEMPRTFALLPPWPNPFNAGTTIAFDLPRATEVELVVFDLAGRSVRRLVRGTLPAGRQRLTWDGRGDSGRTLPSGVYFLRLQAGSMIEARKVLILRF